MQKQSNKPFRINKGSLPKIDEVWALLVEQYPKCFVAKGEQPKPLAVGIAEKIYEELKLSHPNTVGKSSLKSFLAIYTSSNEYNNAMIEDGAMRINLAGEGVKPVSQEHQDIAKNSPRRVEIVEKAPKPKKESQSSKKEKPKQSSPESAKSPKIEEPKRKTLTLNKKKTG